MKRFISSIAIMALAITGAAPALSQIYIPVFNCEDNNTCAMYVDDSFTGTGGGTKSNPYKSITPALNFIKASEDYSRIYIAGGTYDNETLPWEIDNTFDGELQILGGYDSTFTTRDPEANPVIIDANGAGEIFDITGVPGVIDGITFTGGNSTSIDRLLNITNTGATSHNFTVRNNVFRDNEGAGSGSVLTMGAQGSNTGKIENNMFFGNDLPSAFILSSTGEIDVMNNLIYTNKGGSVLGCGLDGVIANNFIMGNTGNRIIQAVGGCSFLHNTVVDNDAIGSNDTAIVTTGNGPNDFRNNIFAYNGGIGDLHIEAGTESTFDYNVIFDNTNSGTVEDNNTECDPLLANKDSVDPEDLKLGSGSDCIDAGVNINPSIVATDYFGTSRPADGDGQSGANNDPGAYEAPDLQVPAPEISNVEVSPDPFSPNGDGYQDTTTISFDLSQEATVSIEVIIDNSKIELLASEVRPAGTVSVTWDSSYIDNNSVSQEAVDGTYSLEIGASNSGGSDFTEPTVTIDRTLEEPAPSGECAGYSDVPASHPSCDAIEYVQSTGAMTGNPDGTFAPNELLQRDQVAKISLETFGLFNDSEDYCNGTDPFPDVPPAQWSYQYICQGVDVGMITGYEAGADAGFYRPAREVNRVEFLALILRNLSDTMPADSSTSYSDVEANQWFSGYARYSLDNDLFEGPNLFPTQGTERVEVADVLYKLHNLGKI